MNRDVPYFHGITIGNMKLIISQAGHYNHQSELLPIVSTYVSDSVFRSTFTS